MVVRVKDDVLLGVTYKLAVAQGLVWEAAGDLDKHIICEATHCVPLVWASSIWKSQDTTCQRYEAAVPCNCIVTHPVLRALLAPWLRPQKKLINQVFRY
jgi:hypothetical protein